MAAKTVLADTHTLIWWLFEPQNLSPAAQQALQDAEAAGDPILVATITVVELCYLTEKGKLPAHYLQDTLTALDDPSIALTPMPLEMATARVLMRIARGVVPDMPDRIIAAMALAAGLPLVTKDHKIQALTNITTIW
jgi:PIN domain nuclease of toxin-antitoxin system